MKVIGIVCSPRVGGNTEILVQEALKGAQEAGADVELVSLAGKTISPCHSCYACDKTGECRIKDDMQMLYPKLREDDGIILGTPVYFWSVSGQAKVFLDRTHALYRQRQLRNKVGGAIVVARRAGASAAYNLINTFFLGHRIIPAGGAMGYAGDKGEITKDEQSMTEAKLLGRAVVRIRERYRP